MTINKPEEKQMRVKSKQKWADNWRLMFLVKKKQQQWLKEEQKYYR